MNTKYKSYKWHFIGLLLLVMIFIQWHLPQGLAASNVNLVIDGENIIASPLPVIQNDRTLVPIRLVSEELGAEVEWNEENRTVHIEKGNRSVVLRIDSHLVEYDTGNKVYNLSDVAPKIIGDRTFVPIRLVSNALGVAVRWEDDTRTVSINSNSDETLNIMPFFDIKISTVTSGQIITGITELQALSETVPQGAAEIRYLLIDPDTGRGTVVARGRGLTDKYYWLPDLQKSGEKVLVAAIYNDEGVFLSGDAVPVQVSVDPKATLTGVAEGEVIGNTISLQSNLNFVAPYVKYEITNQDRDKVFVTNEADPQGVYHWTPMMEDNGNVTIKIIAYDHLGQAYPGQEINIKVDVQRRLEIRGFSSGSTIEKPITLSASRNFQVSQTEYVMKDPKTGKEEVLAQVGYESYRWFPGTELSGEKELFVRVKDTSGHTHSSEGVPIKLTGTPKLIIEGVGPKQVVTGSVKLKSFSNADVKSIQYFLTNSKTGERKVIGSTTDPQAESTWTPTNGDAGECKIQAEGILASGARVSSEVIPVTVFMGTTYGAKPVIEKNRFLDLASGLAGESSKKYGMSAALQTAQAILETGWGQSVPVDKYSGKFSNNLFGIKGSGPSGSVVSNTWEEYNGQTFRVDANFRAYGGVNDSWADHKKLLLTASRYEPFRAVMHDSTQGAWALRRCGYATDSKYPLKLINIMNTYGLNKLDEVGI